MSEAHLPHRGWLLIPRIRVQNANAISSPLTWGFPAITAFTGLMTALERRLGPEADISLLSVGVVCHSFEAQVTTEGYTRAFHLTRNPVLQDGSTAAIVEEGRVHLDISLVFDVRLGDSLLGDAERAVLAERITQTLAGMRLAGGSVMPQLPTLKRQPQRPWLDLVPGDATERRERFRRLTRRLIPGFALISRDDLLQQRLTDLRARDANASTLDAWLDLAGWTSRAAAVPAANQQEGSVPDHRTEWVTDPRPGWIVPIPVGFTALSPLLPGGTVAGARDMATPFRFVETIWSIGQWISPHRLQCIEDLVWQSGHDHNPEQPMEHGLYRCFMDNQSTATGPI